MTGRPDVTVVVPCYGVGPELDDQLRALGRQDFDGSFEVVLADNGANPELAVRAGPLAALLHLEVRVVDARAVRGVSHARNTGLRAARADLVAICDADDEVSPGWLAALHRAAGDHALVGGEMETAQLNSPVVRAWRPGPPTGRLPRKLDHLEYAMGCNLAVRRDVALQLGGWCEDYVAGGDDVDFAWRLQHSGHSLGYAPGAVVHYRFRDDLAGSVRQTYAYARCEALLLREFRTQGARGRRPGQTIRDVRWLIGRRGDRRADLGARGRWACRAASLRGRVAGAVRYRCWPG